MSQEYSKALRTALHHVDRLASLTPAYASKLAQLRADLEEMDAGSRPPATGMVRWVTDWIPDVNDPLVHAVGVVESFARPA